jgi:Virulence factor Evf
MSKQELLSVQAAQRVEQSEAAYERSRDFFHSIPLRFAAAAGQAPAPPPTADTNSQGTVQFQLIGQQPTDPAYNDIVNQNTANLLDIGGLIFDYMHTHFPTVNAAKLDVNTWQNVVAYVPDLSIGSAVSKTYNNNVKGVQVSGEFLSLIAKAIITDGASLLTDFTSYLNSVGGVVFSSDVKSQSYNAITCTYVSYLISNGVGGYFDYGAIVLRQITFLENFQQYKSICGSVESIDIKMSYTEITNLVRTQRIRKGGPDYENFQSLINKNSTDQFNKAKNFFNAGKTPQNQLTPQAS